MVWAMFNCNVNSSASHWWKPCLMWIIKPFEFRRCLLFVNTSPLYRGEKIRIFWMNCAVQLYVPKNNYFFLNSINEKLYFVQLRAIRPLPRFFSLFEDFIDGDVDVKCYSIIINMLLKNSTQIWLRMMCLKKVWIERLSPRNLSLSTLASLFFWPSIRKNIRIGEILRLFILKNLNGGNYQFKRWIKLTITLGRCSI